MIPLVIVLVVLLILVLLIAFSGTKPLAWSDKMTVTTASIARQEWVAPDYVREQVRTDYLSTARWLSEVTRDPDSALDQAPCHLTGGSLETFRRLVDSYRACPHVYETFKADHYVSVRHFSPDGRACLLVDRQIRRVITICASSTGQPRHTQAIEDAYLCYRMIYDRPLHRWMIESQMDDTAIGTDARASFLLHQAVLLLARPVKSGRLN